VKIFYSASQSQLDWLILTHSPALQTPKTSEYRTSLFHRISPWVVACPSRPMYDS